MLSAQWRSFLRPYYGDEAFERLLARAEAAYAEGTVYPPRQQLFSAFAATPPQAVRAVILGQDPYHEPGQANGLAFSVPDGAALPPSLRNIYRELSSDLGVPAPAGGDLRPWAAQGVLLLNAALTVEAHAAGSHRALGWQEFTDAVIRSLEQAPQPIAFILWGGWAGKKAALTASAHPRLVLQGPHPSPLSAYRGFFGSRPFSAVNEFLLAHGEPPIRWTGR